MLNILFDILYSIFEIVTFGWGDRENRRFSSTSVLISLLVFSVLVFVFLLVYRFLVQS